MCIKRERIYLECGCKGDENYTLCEGCIAPCENQENSLPEYLEGVCPDCQTGGSAGIYMIIVRSATQLLNALITPIKYLMKKDFLVQLN
jgi:hypothetical protein